MKTARLHIVNIPGPFLTRKTPRAHPAQYAPECHREAAERARELDLAPGNVTMTLDGVAWLLSAHVIVSAETREEAEAIAAQHPSPTFKRSTDPAQ